MNGAPRLLRVSAWGALLALCAACASLPPPPPARQNGYRYADRRLGIALELPPGWRGFTSRSELPPELRDAIPRGFGPKPAMVGSEERGAAFVRVLTEPVLGMSTLEYFEAVTQAPSGRSTSSPRRTPARPTPCAGASGAAVGRCGSASSKR